MKEKIFQIFYLLRPHQYIKNILVFAPLFFAGRLGNTDLLLNSFYAFIAFCLIASSIYILNDYNDIESDRKHPKKKHRPLASGTINKNVAISLMFCLLLISSFISLQITTKAFFIILSYFILNIAYCLYLKNIAILDTVIIATGFVLRLFLGSAASHVKLSMWIILTTFLLALFIALAKRRDDVLIFNKTGKKMRQSIGGYNLEFIDNSMMIMATIVIVSYIQYTTSAEVLSRINSKNIYLTVVFVILGIMRYLQIVFVEKKSGSPTNIILKDKAIIATSFLWLASFYFILYS